MFQIEFVTKMDSKRVFSVWISIVCCFMVVACDEYKTIETTNGLVRGRRGTTLLNNISHYSFKGIPYAKPPVGDLRLKVIIFCLFIAFSLREFWFSSDMCSRTDNM